MSAPRPLPDEGGRLADNVAAFARLLRKAGLAIGPGRVLDAVDALSMIDIARKDDFYWTLHAVFVDRRENSLLFEHAFHLFWRADTDADQALAALTLDAQGDASDLSPAPGRLADALSERSLPHPVRRRERRERDANCTWSGQESLRSMDFETMSGEEMRAAKRALAVLALPLADIPRRRLRADLHGRRPDIRASLRAGVRSGGEIMVLKRRSPVKRPPALVALCDISGSMSRYSRMLLHFLHGVTGSRPRVHTFLFGTRLTNVTRHLRHRDVDQALSLAGRAAKDWSGGTRIGAALCAFNRDWSRRLPLHEATVLLITDGLEREETGRLAFEAERLRLSCRRLVWLNPLLRYSEFEAKAAGIRAILPHVDDFRPAHNIDSLEALANVLARPPRPASPLTGTARLAS